MTTSAHCRLDTQLGTQLGTKLLVAIIVFTGLSVSHPCSAAEKDALTVSDAQVVLIQNTPIASPIAGTIESFNAKEGQTVAVGDVLVQLDSTRARQEIIAAEAGLRAALLQANNDVNERYALRTREVQQRELEKSEEANERYARSVSESELQRLQLVIDQAGLSIEQAEQEREIAAATANEKRAAVGLATLRMHEHEICSPVGGSIAEVMAQPGQWVEAGTPLVRIISLNPIRVSCFVDGRNYDRSLVGREVTFSIPVSDLEGATENADSSSGTSAPELLHGVITFVSDELNPVTSQVRVFAQIENPDHIARPGLRGTLTIQANAGATRDELGSDLIENERNETQR